MLSKSPQNPSAIEYASSAPLPAVTSHAQDGQHDEAVPTHLYDKLPRHLLENGTPDYLRMILMSKVYSAPLNLAETPLTHAVNLSKRLGCEIYLKREDLHPVFSFKIRGAYNMMAHLTEAEKRQGVITCSAGNHAQGVALSGKALGIPATVLMPMSTPDIKVNNVRRLGGTVVLHGQDFDEAKAECLRRSAAEGLTFIPPYDDPYVVAGQGTIALELLRQLSDPERLDGIFAAVGGGGLVAGIAAYVKRVASPAVRVFGVETHDADAMKRSLDAGRRVLLDEVGPFADGTAVRIVGEEPFRVCRELLDGVELVGNDEICAAIKDVFEETRSIPEPSGALALAGLKAHITRSGLVGSGKRFVAVVSGGNMNFGRLRFVAERAELGERREVLMSFKVPEGPGSFLKLHSRLAPRTVTEFSYRLSPLPSSSPSSSSASSTPTLSSSSSLPPFGYIICSFLLLTAAPTPAQRAAEVGAIIAALRDDGVHAVDLSEDEFAKSHVRHLVGGRSGVPDERVFRFEFPERPGALARFLANLRPAWNISMFHYRNHGADVGKVLVGLQAPSVPVPGGHGHGTDTPSAALEGFLEELGYPYVEETSNPVYRNFLCV
ncbi:threonine deaminase [Cryptotrichosporon argae]